MFYVIAITVQVYCRTDTQSTEASVSYLQATIIALIVPFYLGLACCVLDT